MAPVLDVNPVHVGHASAAHPVPVCIQVVFVAVIVGLVAVFVVLVKTVD